MPSLLSKSFIILRGLLYATGFVCLWAWIAASVRPFDAHFPISIPAWLHFIGYGIFGAGILLAAACIGIFITKGQGTPAPFDPPRIFVAIGPYRYVRNPMYVGGSAVILGSGLALSSPSIIALSFGFLLCMHLLVVFHEEPALAVRFGASYQHYFGSVHRWLIKSPNPNAQNGVG